MSQEQSDGEDSMVETEDGPVDDGTAETEVNFRLPCGSDPGPEGVQKDIPIVTGAVGVEADTPDPGQPRRLGHLGGAKPKRPTFELPTAPTPGTARSLPGAGTQPVIDRFVFERPTPTYPAPGRPLPGAGTQPVSDRFAYELPTPTYPAPGRSLPGAGAQPVTDRFAYELPNLPISGQGRRPPWTRTQPVPDRFMDDPPDMPYPVHGHD